MTSDVTELTELQIAAHRTGDALLAQGGTAPAKGTTPAEAEALWRSYATVYTRVSRKHRAQYGVTTAKPAADAAIEQMLRIGEARKLVQDVRKLRRKAIGITVEFMDAEELPQNTSRRNENNFFLPNEVDRGRYTLYIVWVPDVRADELGLLHNTKYALGVSELADSVFHELLHVWFLHVLPDDSRFGHGEPEFERRLERFRRDMLELDKQLKPRPRP